MMKASASILIRILTHNIRYAANPPANGEKPWSVRKQLLLNELHYNTLYNEESLICLQEVLHEQLVDIMNGLGDEWGYIGVGRDDGKKAGEYGPIIYRKSVWQVETWRTVWLNETGKVGQKGWDAACVRIVTVGTFHHVRSKKKLMALCTHFDHIGVVARRESAKIILNILSSSADSTCGAEQMPSFLAGDLNSDPSDGAYQVLNSDSSALQDARELAKWKYGNHYTFTDFDDKDLSVIDFVFVGPRGKTDWDIKGYSVLNHKFDDGIYNSDHRAVVIDTILSL